MPVLARLQSEFQDKGLQVLAINIQSNYYSLEEWADFMKRFAPDGLQRLTESMAVQDMSGQAIVQYELKVLGTEVLVDREGRVVARSDGPMGYQKLRSKIADLVG